LVERRVGIGLVGPLRVRPVSGVWARVSSRPVPPTRRGAGEAAFRGVAAPDRREVDASFGAVERFRAPAAPDCFRAPLAAERLRAAALVEPARLVLAVPAAGRAVDPVPLRLFVRAVPFALRGAAALRRPPPVARAAALARLVDGDRF
jgi:hypothetical protein